MNTESVKIKTEAVNIAREIKDKQGIPIGRLFEIAIKEYVDSRRSVKVNPNNKIWDGSKIVDPV